MNSMLSSFHAQVAPVVKNVAVDKSLASCQADFVLVEEQVAQTVMDQRAVEKFRRLRLMRLAAADDHRPGLRHAAEVALLVGLRFVIIVFEVLVGSDGQVTFSAAGE